MSNAQETLTTADATKRLMEAARNHPQLGLGHDADWVASYMALRQSSKRPRAEDIVKFHNSRQTDLGHEGYRERKFFGVPKENFPNGFPAKWAKHLAQEERLQELEQREQCRLDREAFYLLDGGAIDIFGQLGLNVETFGFRQRRRTTYKPPPATITEEEDHGSAATSYIGIQKRHRFIATLLTSSNACNLQLTHQISFDLLILASDTIF